MAEFTGSCAGSLLLFFPKNIYNGVLTAKSREHLTKVYRSASDKQEVGSKIKRCYSILPFQIL